MSFPEAFPSAGHAPIADGRLALPGRRSGFGGSGMRREMMVSKVVKVVWLVLALVGSAGLVLWMSEHGDLGSKMSGPQDGNKFTIQN